MTPTRHALDEALPPVPSGISALGGDLTEPDEPGSDRAMALDWLEKFYAEAHEIGRKQALTEITEIAARVGADEELQHCDSGLDAVLPAGNPESGPEVPRNETRTYSAAIDAVHDACQTLDDDRRRYGPRHGDRWEVRNGRAVIVGSNDWPGPANGTHESDLGVGLHEWDAAVRNDDDEVIFGDYARLRGGRTEYSAARDWSRTPEREEAK